MKIIFYFSIFDEIKLNDEDLLAFSNFFYFEKKKKSRIIRLSVIWLEYKSVSEYFVFNPGPLL